MSKTAPMSHYGACLARGRSVGSCQRETIAHLGTLDFVVARENVVFLGPPEDATHCTSM